MAQIAREWAATNREDPVLDVQGPSTAEGFAALVPAGEEFNPGQMHNLFKRVRTDLVRTNRGLSAVEQYVSISFLVFILFILSS